MFCLTILWCLIHRCSSLCHTGPCPPCELPVSVSCRCGSHNIEISATEYRKNPPPWLCDTMCDKIKVCRRHRCHEACCVLRSERDPAAHDCFVPCKKPLRCGQHACEQLCHPGHCPPCINIVTEELECECGKTILFPPQPCGTRRPVCRELCIREHACDHPVSHNCHYEAVCPPCPVLVTRLCVGGHGNRCSSTPCHVSTPTCLEPCGRMLACGVHPCPSKCHGGPCQDVISRDLIAPPITLSVSSAAAAAPSDVDLAWGDSPLPSAQLPSCGMKVPPTCTFI